MFGCRNLCGAMLGLLPAVLMVSPMFAESASKAYPLEIKVLNSEYRSLDSSTPVPKDCDMQNYSAYCNESRNPSVENVMLVQEKDGKSFSIACTVDSRWSRCAPLPVGETFEARKEKNGITVLYRNAKGKEKKEFYQLIAAAPVPPADVATNPQTQASPAIEISPATAPSASAVKAPPPASGETVRCNFSSTPAGAEITLDGKYVGNTPSEIAVTIGTHAVAISMSGFASWQRDLTVLPGSELTVSAFLQKQ